MPFVPIFSFRRDPEPGVRQAAKPPGTRARGHATSTRKAPLNPPPKSSGPKLAVATFGGAFRAI